MSPFDVRICLPDGKKTRCRECGDSAWIEWRCKRRRAFYCSDCAELLGLAVSVYVAALDLGVTARTVRKWCREDKIASYSTVHGPWKILRPYNKRSAQNKVNANAAK